ncbi:MAG: hypothetical protein MO853_06115 [Candidatus Protistobacter heckmanni]|nr:hypothetical protein [Candidatus Protistobacter heckmanni]
MVSEVFLFPLIWLRSYLLWIGVPWKKRRSLHARNVADTRMLLIFNEWAGYPPLREKEVDGRRYRVGRQFLFQALPAMREALPCELRCVADVCCDPGQTTPPDMSGHGIELRERENHGFDIAGYFMHLMQLQPAPEDLVVFCNSSVPEQGYVLIPELAGILAADPGVGLVGLSSCARLYASILPLNLVPHIQSYLVMLRYGDLQTLFADYLSDSAIDRRFPTHTDAKRLGEIMISYRYLRAGYALATSSGRGAMRFHPSQGVRASGMPLQDHRGMAT